jgi:hypothetical protein
MPREVLSPGRLYTLLNDELRAAQRTNGCVTCRMPLPFLIERPDDVSANWRLGTPHPCGFGCDVVIGEIAARLWPRFDLHDPLSVPLPRAETPKPA